MVPPDQSGAPVLAFSQDRVNPGGSAYAVIVPLFSEMVDQWNLEVGPGEVLPMYEGPRVCGRGTVLWRENTSVPLNETTEQRYLSWLDDPTMPLATD